MERDGTVVCLDKRAAADVRALDVAHHVEVERVAPEARRLAASPTLDMRDAADGCCARGGGSGASDRAGRRRVQHDVRAVRVDRRLGVAEDADVARETGDLSTHVDGAAVQILRIPPSR